MTMLPHHGYYYHCTTVTLSEKSSDRTPPTRTSTVASIAEQKPRTQDTSSTTTAVCSQSAVRNGKWVTKETPTCRRCGTQARLPSAEVQRRPGSVRRPSLELPQRAAALRPLGLRIPTRRCTKVVGIMETTGGSLRRQLSSRYHRRLWPNRCA